MQIDSNERLNWIDAIRSMAILSVVMCHVVEGSIYTLDFEFMQSVGTLSKWFAFGAFSIGRIGVPFFLMISGYLLLDKKYDDTECKRFWKSKCLGLLITTEFWIVAYEIFSYYFNQGDLSVGSIVRQMLLWKSSSMNHMWYMPMILGMYLTLPIVANALHTIETKTMPIPYGIIVLCAFGVPTLNVIGQAHGFNVGNSLLSMGFSGGVYGIYLITGYLLKKGVLKKIPSWILGVAAGISFACAFYMQIDAYGYNIKYNLWYDNLFLLICGIACFELISRVKNVPGKRIFSKVSKYSFAIYLVHNPVNLVLKRYTSMLSPRPLRVLVVWGVTLLCSLLISYLINKIPKMGKMILYMR